MLLHGSDAVLQHNCEYPTVTFIMPIGANLCLPQVMIAQTAPAVRVAIGEEVGLPPGAIETHQMVAGLRQLGFDYVFDTDFAADLTIMEEGAELLHRLKLAWGLEKSDGEPPPPLPMFTSCCPAWVSLIEKGVQVISFSNKLCIQHLCGRSASAVL